MTSLDQRLPVIRPPSARATGVCCSAFCWCRSTAASTVNTSGAAPLRPWTCKPRRSTNLRKDFGSWTLRRQTTPWRRSGGSWKALKSRSDSEGILTPPLAAEPRPCRVAYSPDRRPDSGYRSPGNSHWLFRSTLRMTAVPRQSLLARSESPSATTVIHPSPSNLPRHILNKSSYPPLVAQP